jgi:hypothetical protein
MCKAFMSCKITVGMILEKIVIMTFIASMINLFGAIFTIVMDKQLTCINIVVIGIIILTMAILIMFIVGVVVMLIAEVVMSIPSPSKQLSRTWNKVVFEYTKRGNKFVKLNNFMCDVLKSPRITFADLVYKSIIQVGVSAYLVFLGTEYVKFFDIPMNFVNVMIGVCISITIYGIFYYIVRIFEWVYTTIIHDDYLKINSKVIFKCKK